MNKNKMKIICFITTFVFLFTYISFLLSGIYSYAQDESEYFIAESYSKPKSGTFKSGGFKGYSTNPKTTIIKPDSGGFSTKPKSSTINPKSSNSVKPDSGSFSTKPKTNNNNESKNNTNSNRDYNDYGGSSIFGNRGFYGYGNPFYRVMYGFRVSSWIIKLVVIITVIVVIYVLIDFVRSRRL